MPVTDDPAECAKQMQTILKASHIPYSSLIEAPENLLRVSPGCENHGALWTRFTVQYNLYAGSIVALGSDEQRDELISTQVSVLYVHVFIRVFIRVCVCAPASLSH